MEIVFTFHAKHRMKKRRLIKEEVVDAIKFPDKTVKKHGKYFFQKKLCRGTIEVVVEKTENILNVVTIYWL